jgi:hypothetical protein
MWTGRQAIQCSDGLTADTARALKHPGPPDENIDLADEVETHWEVGTIPGFDPGPDLRAYSGLMIGAAQIIKRGETDSGLADRILHHFGVDEDHDCGDDIWTGEWPGVVECREFGFWSYWSDDDGWVRCTADHPQASEDLNTLVSWCRWDRAAGRWVLPDGKLPAGMGR